MSGLFADVETLSLLGQHAYCYLLSTVIDNGDPELRVWSCGTIAPATNRAHLATAHADAHFADRVRAAQEKAWDEGHQEGDQHSDGCDFIYEAARVNPYRRTDKEADRG